MAQHITYLTVIGSILAAALSKQLADEFKAWVPWLTRRLIDRAVSALPEQRLKDRCGEEWTSYIADIPGEIGKIVAVLGFLRAAEQMRFDFLVRNAKTKLQQHGLVEILEAFVMARLELKEALGEWEFFYAMGLDSRREDGGGQYALLPLPANHASYVKRSARGPRLVINKDGRK